MLDLVSEPSSTSGPSPSDLPLVHDNGPVHSCYTSPCHHGDDLATCAAGQFSCAQEEVSETVESIFHAILRAVT